ncbi:MAG: hypothetical protein CME64_10180 [Halobacteriovoraceae bacterium]|nr:hypothetical protein [Halobacteriovoraceae bacterium]
MIKFTLLMLLSVTHVFANLAHAPQNFSFNENKFVFVDFVKANYSLNYDVAKRKALYTAKITFSQPTEGSPIFDVVDSPSSIKVNGKEVLLKKVNSPGDETKYVSINTFLAPGLHTFEITGEIETNTDFTSDSARSGFWMSDLTDRRYLEQYLPTNLEFDQFEIEMDVQVTGTETPHRIFSNGKLTEKSTNHFHIKFPEYFSTSSLYFHLSEKGRFKVKTFTHKSIDGREIPIVTYSKSSWSLYEIKEKTLKIFKELESKFGPWGHPSFTAYIAGMGGMEHSGATITSRSALGHEITHSYFARGVLPTNGNSGWLDEAIASWRDKGYRAISSPSYSSTNLAAFSDYKRTTTRKAYSEGASFMAFLNLKLNGNLEGFLKKMYEDYLHGQWTTEIFLKELNGFSGQDFTKSFKKYVYGSNEKSHDKHGAREHSPMHPKLTKQQLRDLL